MGKPRRFQVVERFVERTKRDGSTFFRGGVIEREANEIVEVYCRPEFHSVLTSLTRLECGDQFAAGPLSGSQVSTSLNVTSTTKVMSRCAPFTANSDVIKAYLTPSLSTFDQIRSSPKKRRVSFRGVVKQVTDGSSGMKCVRLEDGSGVSRLTLNLWDSARFGPVEVDGKIKVSAVEVLSQGVVTSCQSTSIENEVENLPTSGEVEAISDPDEHGIFSLWLSDGTVLYASDDFKAFVSSMVLPCKVSFEINARMEVVVINLV